MEEWIRQALSTDRLGIAGVPAAFLLGAAGALSSCCTLPVIGAVAGYAGSLGERPDRRQLLIVGMFFMTGTIVSLAALGAVTGLVGQAAAASVGKYWRFVAGLLLVVFGLVNLEFLRIRIPRADVRSWTLTTSPGGAIVYGLAVGGVTAACSVFCNPLLPMAVGAAVWNGAPVMGTVLLAVFGLGYSLPLTAGLVGVGFGLNHLGRLSQRVMPVVRAGVGVLLIALGFYLLVTM